MREILVSKGKAIALVDEDDYDFLMQWRWCLAGKYAARSEKTDEGKKRWVFMHHVVLKRKTGKPIPNGLLVDHKDRNRLNNTRHNLRAVTRRENALNIHKFDHFAHAQRFSVTGKRY